MSETRGTKRTPPPAILQSVLEAYERGQTIEALERATEFAPLQDWDGLKGCQLAGRVAMNARRRSVGHPSCSANVAHRQDAPTVAIHLRPPVVPSPRPPRILATGADLAAPGDDDHESHADFLALQSRAMSDLRDFTIAEKLIDRAESLAPKTPWIRLQQAYLYERLEKVDEALETASAACKLHRYPFYRPGVQATAFLLQLLDRDEEAKELLERADANLQSASPLAAQLYALLCNLQQWGAAEGALERYATLSPLREKAANLWLQAQRARVAYQLGKRSAALGYVRELKDSFHQQFAERLAAPAPVRNRCTWMCLLCGNTSRPARQQLWPGLGRYWNMPADHLAIVEIGLLRRHAIVGAA